MLTPLLNFRTDYNIERTLVFNGAEDTTKAILHAFYAAKGTWDVCGDSTAPSVAMEYGNSKEHIMTFSNEVLR